MCIPLLSACACLIYQRAWSYRLYTVTGSKVKHWPVRYIARVLSFNGVVQITVISEASRPTMAPVELKHPCGTGGSVASNGDTGRLYKNNASSIISACSYFPRGTLLRLLSHLSCPVLGSSCCAEGMVLDCNIDVGVEIAFRFTLRDFEV